MTTTDDWLRAKHYRERAALLIPRVEALLRWIRGNASFVGPREWHELERILTEIEELKEIVNG